MQERFDASLDVSKGEGDIWRYHGIWFLNRRLESGLYLDSMCCVQAEDVFGNDTVMALIFRGEIATGLCMSDLK